MSELALSLIAENKITKATFLDLGNCGLTAVPEEISELLWLESLSLGGHWPHWDDEELEYRSTQNEGESNKGLLDISALAGLAQLESLFVAESQLVDLSPLTGLGKMRQLQIASTEISNLAALSALVNLRLLIMSGDQIHDLAPLSSLIDLQSLTIAGDLIRDLSPLSNLDKLKILRISGVLIKKIYPLRKLVGLQNLSIWRTQVSDLRPLVNLIGLQSLTFSGKKLVNITPLSRLVNLKSLVVWETKVNDLTPLENLDGLTSLHLSDIGTSDLSPISGLTGLKMLYLGDAKTSDISPLANLTGLTTLHIFNLSVDDLAPLAGLVGLKRLYISGAQVRNLEPLAHLLNLEALDASGTQVRDLGPISGLVNLKSLNVSGSGVFDLSPIQFLIERGIPVRWSAEFWRDVGIYVENCPLRNPPVEIVHQGNDAILNYFRERANGQLDHLYEAKLLILGEGGAGKTSLLRRLYKPEQALPAENETTKGIDIYRHDFILKNGRTFRLNVWDFGGQEIYHATHQFFLTQRSLYLLLDDTRKDNKSVSDPGFKNWLDLIDTFGAHSPVLIFQNEKGGRSKEIDLAGIKGHYDNVKERYRGNLENDCAADQLREGIELFAGQLSHIGEELPASWIKVRADIETLSVYTPHIGQQEYFDIYARYLPFDRIKALYLSRYLHDLGVFLHFQDDSLLARTVILQNTWATEAVYRMLDDEIVKTKSGRFDQSDCRRVWQTSDYAEMHPELLALMVNFELCYELPNSDLKTWLAPQLLSPIKPVALVGWAQPEDLVLRFRYAFLPRGIVGRLMVRLHRFVCDPEMATVTCVLFERDTTTVLVELLASGNEIELRARGPERKGLLSVVAAELDSINSAFSGLRDKVGKWIPCNCPKCRKTLDPHLFEEKQLRKRAEDKRLQVECPVSYDEMAVLALLDGIRMEQLPSWSKEVKTAETLRVIKIFLASSAELREDRDGFDLYFRQKNDSYRKQGVYLEIVRWENFLDAMSETRLQDEYNKAVSDCDVFVSLFCTKTGKFTDEEFNVAYGQFKSKARPRVYTYFKDAQISMSSLRPEDFNSLCVFKEKLRDLGHYPTNYNDIEHLNRQFSDQIHKLLELGELT